MSVTSNIVRDPWPPLPYQEFAATQYLLHMSLQVLGKLKLKADGRFGRLSKLLNIFWNPDLPSIDDYY